MDYPLFPWLSDRGCGVLLHPTSFPGELGIGNLGRDAKRFIDFLQAAGMNHWQVCPLGPTGYGDSPYQSFSSFAGNPYLIDLQLLVSGGLLKMSELKPLQALPQDNVDYGLLYQNFWAVLEIAYARFAETPDDISDCGSYSDFKKKQAHWLEPYAAYTACKKHFKGTPWNQWPAEARSYAKFKKSKLFKTLEPELGSVFFQQYLFLGQWKQLRIYAKKKGIKIIGDIPIFVAPDSADVWANPELFQIDKTGKLKAVAGVPPDYFSPLGQLWGNPLYDWAALEKTDFTWWIKRLKHSFTLFDVIRLDHFRGFQQCWSIPAEAKDARKGKWSDGPGIEFFKKIKNEIPDAKLIAEDLGEITPDVIELREQTGLPGMAILQFAFGSGNDNFYLPHNLNPNSVIYSGTHDNDTTLGWYRAANEVTRHHYRTYFETSGNNPQWDFIKAAYASVSRLAMIPMQDLLNHGSEGRMNIPGNPAGNWSWRYSPWELDKLWNENASYLTELKERYYR